MTEQINGVWDTHCHVFPPGFPAAEGKTLPVGGGTLGAYRDLCDRLSISVPVFVQSNAYGLDNAALLATLADWGPGARGVAAVAPGTDEAELRRLHDAGVRGVRIMNLGGGAVGLDRLSATAEMVRPFGWTPIVQFDGSDILDHAALLSSIEGSWVLDHFGKFIAAAPTREQMETIFRLMDGGCCVKLSAPYEFSRSGAPRFEDVAAIAEAVLSHNPQQVIWGSNWPHILNAPDGKPDDVALWDTVIGWIPERHRPDVLIHTPERLFG